MQQPLQFNYNINIAKANMIGNCDMITNWKMQGFRIRLLKEQLAKIDVFHPLMRCLPDFLCGLSY